MLNFDWLAGLSLTSAKAIFLTLFVLSAIAVVRLPRAYVMQGAEDAPWWMDLRLWTLAILGILSGVYLYF